MAAAAAVGSCFSATLTPCLRSKHVHSDAALPKVTCPRAVAHLADRLSIAIASSRKLRRLPKIWAAVAQEETAAAVEEEQPVEKEPEEVEVEVEVEEGGGDSEVVAPEATQNTKLYFGNLPYNCDSAQLAGIVQEHASPDMIEVLYDKDTGRSRGFAFVTMSSIEDCDTVIRNLDGTQYGGRTLRVNFSDKPKPKEPLYPESEYKLFVGNLSWSVTSEDLTQVFQEYGNLVGARVLYDGDTGQSRGYGFVCYSTKQEMDVALESLNGVELQGRSMRISLALGKKS